MKILKIIIILLMFLSLNSCGFSKLNDETKNISFGIINIDGNKRITYELKNKINLIAKKNAERKYDVNIFLSDSRESKIKNVAGKTTRYNLRLSADVKLKDNYNQKEYNRLINVSSDYDVSNNHSDTIKNEKIALQRNIEKLSEEITKYIQLITLN